MVSSLWTPIFLLLCLVWLVDSIEQFRVEPFNIWSTADANLSLIGFEFQLLKDVSVSVCGTWKCEVHEASRTDENIGCTLQFTDVEKQTVCSIEQTALDSEGGAVMKLLERGLTVNIPALGFQIPSRIPINLNATTRIALKESFGMDVGMSEIYVNGISTEIIESSPAYALVQQLDGEPTSSKNVTIVGRNKKVFLSVSNADVETYQTGPDTTAIDNMEPTFLVKSGRSYTIGYSGQNLHRVQSIVIRDAVSFKKFPCYIVSKDDVGGRYVSCMFSSSRQINVGLHQVFLYLTDKIALMSELQVLPEPTHQGLLPSKCPVNYDCRVKVDVQQPPSVPFAIRQPNGVYVSHSAIAVNKRDVSFMQNCRDKCSGGVSMVSSATYNGVETLFMGHFESLQETTLPGFTDIVPRALTLGSTTSVSLFGYNLERYNVYTTTVSLVRDENDGKTQHPLPCDVEVVSENGGPTEIRFSLPLYCFIVNNCKAGIYKPVLGTVQMDNQVSVKLTLNRIKATGVVFKFVMFTQYQSQTAAKSLKSAVMHIGDSLKINHMRLAGAGISPHEQYSSELIFYILDVNADEQSARSQASQLFDSIKHRASWQREKVGAVSNSPGTYGFEAIGWCDLTETYSRHCTDKSNSNGVKEVLIIVFVITVSVSVLGISIWCYQRRAKKNQKTDADIVVPLFENFQINTSE